MIAVKKINNKDIVVNCELIQTIEGGSDTVITMRSGEKLIVADHPDEIVLQSDRIQEGDQWLWY